MTSLMKLVRIGGPALTNQDPRQQLASLGARARELHGMLTQRNGFYCFEGALHIFPSGHGDMPLEAWNSVELWRSSYGGMTHDYLFFAEDIFGNQYGIEGGKIISFDAETAEAEIITDTLEEWAAKVLAEYEYMTGYPLAHSWQEKNGRLPLGKRLIAKVPFVAGGEFNEENLYPLDSVQAMRWHGDLARQIRDLPDGASIKFDIVP